MSMILGVCDSEGGDNVVQDSGKVFIIGMWILFQLFDIWYKDL